LFHGKERGSEQFFLSAAIKRKRRGGKDNTFPMNLKKGRTVANFYNFPGKGEKGGGGVDDSL